MNPDEALALAKRMFAQLARLSPRGAKYREIAAVLVDVLAYAGREIDAEGLALAVSGRYPHDQSHPPRQPGDPVASEDQVLVLFREVEAARQRAFGSPRNRCGLTPKAVAAWLKRIGTDASREDVDAIVARIERACVVEKNYPQWALDDVIPVLQSLGLDIQDTFSQGSGRVDYIRMPADDTPTLAVVWPRGREPRFIIRSFDGLFRWRTRR